MFLQIEGLWIFDLLRRLSKYNWRNAAVFVSLSSHYNRPWGYALRLRVVMPSQAQNGSPSYRAAAF